MDKQLLWHIRVISWLSVAIGVLAFFILFMAAKAGAETVSMPVTVTIINCVDTPDHPRCVMVLNGISPESGEPGEDYELITVDDGVQVDVE